MGKIKITPNFNFVNYNLIQKSGFKFKFIVYSILPLCPLTLVFCTIQHSIAAEVIAQA